MSVQFTEMGGAIAFYVGLTRRRLRLKPSGYRRASLGIAAHWRGVLEEWTGRRSLLPRGQELENYVHLILRADE
jgi:hypothetical protein